MSLLVITLLELIARHDGKLTWYHLDRMVADRKLPIDQMMTELTYLKDAGLIRADPPTGHGQPRYYVTEAGRNQLTEALDERG